MSEITLEIDYREKSVIKLIEETNNFPFKYNISNLIIGDFVIKQNEDVLYILERKTIMDLSASITDGRFREQKQRLFESVNGCFDKIIYIIEGNRNLKKYGSIAKSTINSSIINLIFKHKYKVIHTIDEVDTIDNLINIVI
jgi:ERCC4-type nuclease